MKLLQNSCFNHTGTQSNCFFVFFLPWMALDCLFPVSDIEIHYSKKPHVTLTVLKVIIDISIGLEHLHVLLGCN